MASNDAAAESTRDVSATGPKGQTYNSQQERRGAAAGPNGAVAGGSRSTIAPRVLTAKPTPMRAKARRAPPLMARRRKAAAPRVPRVLTANPISMKAKARRAPPLMARQRKASRNTSATGAYGQSYSTQRYGAAATAPTGGYPAYGAAAPEPLRIFSTWLSRPTLCCAAYGSQPAPQPYNYSQQAPPPAYGAQAGIPRLLMAGNPIRRLRMAHSRLHRLPLACLRRFSNGPRTCGLD